ncbi:tape-measure protein [Streptomyces sp. NPDC048338]|uniref:tape-measure protein n=1 Tax=Streptomyces sp. NPDC048338 TaxID=3365536 RepID=UPI0037171781
MSAVALTPIYTNRLLAGVPAAIGTLRGAVNPANTALGSLLRAIRDAGGRTSRLASDARAAATAAGRLRADATSAAGSVTKLGRSAAPSGVKSFGDRAGRAKSVLAKTGAGVAAILTVLMPLLPFTDVITGLMDKYGTVMTIASAAMMAVNVAMRGNPLGFLVGIILPVAAALITYAMNSEAGRRIMQQVFQQALKGFQSVWKFLQPVMEFLGQAVMTYFKGYLTLFTTALKVIGSGIGGLSGAGTSVSSASNALRGIASGSMGGIKSGVQPILSFITDKIPGFFHTAKDAVGGALRGIGDLIEGALSTVIGVVKGPINGLIAFANWIIDGLNELSFEIPLTGKKFGVEIDKIPMLAEGGIVLPGTADDFRIDPLSQLDNRRVPALTEAPRPPHRIRDFHEEPGAGPRSTAEDLLFLAAARA